MPSAQEFTNGRWREGVSMAKERTDTERLDWLLRQMRGQRGHNTMWKSYDGRLLFTVFWWDCEKLDRTVIDVSMDAEE